MLYTCISYHLSIYLSIYLPIYLSIYLFIYLSIYPSYIFVICIYYKSQCVACFSQKEKNIYIYIIHTHANVYCWQRAPNLPILWGAPLPIYCLPPFFKFHIWQRVPNPSILWRAHPILPTPLFQILASPPLLIPYLPPGTSNHNALLAALFC